MRLLIAASLLIALGAGIAFGQTKGRAASSAQKAANEGVADCIRLWDAGTHMTKEQWRATCRRVQNRLDDIKAENVQMPKAEKSKAGKPR